MQLFVAWVISWIVSLTAAMFSISPLVHQSVHYSGVRMVQFAVSVGGGVNVVDGRNNSALHVAAKYGRWEQADMLLRMGANLTRNKKHEYPLHIAASANSSSMSKADHLLTLKLFLTWEKQSIKKLDWEGRTPLHRASMLSMSDAVEEILKHSPDVSAQDKFGRTPLHIAVQNSAIRTVTLLLKEDARVHVLDAERMSPMDLAVRRALKNPMFTPLLRLLANHSALVNGSNALGNYLTHVIESDVPRQNKIVVLKALLALKAAVNGTNASRGVPMDLVIRTRFHDAIPVFRSHGASVDGSQKIASFLHFLVSSQVEDEETLQTIMRLLEQGANVNAYDDSTGYLPMDFAVMHKLHKIVGILAKHGANVNGSNLMPSYLHNLLNFANSSAFGNGHVSTIEALVASKAQLDIPNAAGCTPLDVAIFSSQYRVVAVITKKYAPNSSKCIPSLLHYAVGKNDAELVSELLKAGLDVETENSEGKGAMEVAVRNESVKIIELLAKAGVPVKKHKGFCPLSYAMSRSRLNVPLIEMLLSHRADPNIYVELDHEPKQSLPPLHIAARKGASRIVQALIKAEAQIEEHSGIGTPLHHAAIKCHRDVVTLLLKNGADKSERSVTGETHDSYLKNCEK